MDKQPPELGKDRGDEQTFAIIGVAMEVHRVLGHGFLEAVYQEAMAAELEEHLIPFKREVPLLINYKLKTLSCSYKADFKCFEDVLVEMKAISSLTSVDHAQVINYLKATGLSRALLLNFGAPSLQHQRIVLSKNLRESAKSAD